MLCRQSLSMFCRQSLSMFCRQSLGMFCRQSLSMFCRQSLGVFCRQSLSMFCRQSLGVFCRQSLGMFCRQSLGMFCRQSLGMFCRQSLGMFCRLSLIRKRIATERGTPTGFLNALLVYLNVSEEADAILVVLVGEHFIFCLEISCLFKKGSILNLLFVVLCESPVAYLVPWLQQNCPFYPLLPSCRLLLRSFSHPLDNKHALLRLMTCLFSEGGRLHSSGPTSCDICLTVIVSPVGPCVRTALKLTTHQQGDALNTAAGRISSISVWSRPFLLKKYRKGKEKS